MKKSEFGDGFIYSLILFAKHWGMFQHMVKEWRMLREKNPTLFSDEDAVSLWFNGSSDHFYGLVVPEKWENHKIGKLAQSLRSTALHWGHGFMGPKPTLKQFGQFFDDLEKLAILIDKELGVEDKKAKWS